MTPDRLHLLNKPWVGASYHSTFSTHSRGVSILIPSILPFYCEQSLVDVEGRYICLLCRIFNVPCILATIYIPPPYSVTTLNEMMPFLLAHPTLPLLLMGDFNMYLDPSLDKYSGSASGGASVSTALARVLRELHLFDIWRTKYPDMRSYSCFSASYASLSRIDLAIGNQSLLPRVRKTEYLTRGLSDHTPLLVSLELQPYTQTGRPLWKLNPFWLPVLNNKSEICNILRDFFATNRGSAGALIVWETMKAYLRGIFIRQISAIKSRSRAQTALFRNRVTDTEFAYLQTPTSQCKDQWLEAHKALDDHLLQQAEKKRFFLRQRYYIEGESSGHLLASIAKAQRGSSLITEIKTSGGDTVSDPRQILGEFHTFYRALYTSRFAKSAEDLNAFLDGLSFTTLSEEQVEFLDSPITLEEVGEAVAALQNNKSPGVDGLPLEIFKEYSEILLPELLAVYRAALEEGRLPDSMRQANIVVILKPGKDPLMVDSYRPISLLTADIKILAKILAQRLIRVITDLIHGDQSGFIPAKSTAINLRRLFLNLQLVPDNVGERAILSLDAAKAFDSVEWSFLWAVMGRMGFSSVFLSWVQLLYFKPGARILVNGMLSESFDLGRGTRQGCPLSPLLFAIAIEPLAILLRSSDQVRGFEYGTLHEKVALYADDLLLFLGDTSDSLSSAITLITEFGDYSGLRINWGKSVLLPVDTLSPLSFVSSTSLAVVERFKYLGIQISTDFRLFIPLNVTPMVTRFQEKINTWTKLPLSVIGRNNLIKMILMPQLLYILHNSPVWLPFTHFYKFQALFRDLIWKKGSPRIRYETLQRDKTEGGLAAPNPWIYFLASQLQHLKGWDAADCDDPVFQLIKAHVRGSALLPSLEAGFPTLPNNRFPTIKLIVKVWDRIKAIFHIEGCTPFTPLWHNPVLPEFRGLQGFSTWEAAGISLVSHLQSDNIFKSFQQLRDEFGLSSRVFYQFLQLRHAWDAQSKLFNLTVTTAPIFYYLTYSGSKRGAISMFYKLLLEEFLKKYPIIVKAKWENDLGVITEEQWSSVLEMIPQMSTNESLRVSQLYLVHRVYRTPAFLFKIGIRPDARCPRCGSAPADLLHMFWSCTILRPVWSALISYLNQIYGISLPTSPRVCVLGILDDSLGDDFLRIALQRLLYQARKLIAAHWLDPHVPTQREFLEKVRYVIRMERGVYLKRGALSKFDKLWDTWITAHGLSFTD